MESSWQRRTMARKLAYSSFQWANRAAGEAMGEDPEDQLGQKIIEFDL